MLSVWAWADCCRSRVGLQRGLAAVGPFLVDRHRVAARTASMFSCVGRRSAPGQASASAGLPVLDRALGVMAGRFRR